MAKSASQKMLERLVHGWILETTALCSSTEQLWAESAPSVAVCRQASAQQRQLQEVKKLTNGKLIDNLERCNGYECFVAFLILLEVLPADDQEVTVKSGTEEELEKPV